MMSLDDKYKKLLQNVDYALQPIVNIYTGKTYAVEALIRDYDKAGFATIDSVFDTAFSENVLYSLDLELRNIAIKKFTQIPFAKQIKLFYNMDNRTTMMPDFRPGYTKELLYNLGLTTASLCFELSEKHQSKVFAGVDNLLLNMYKQQGYRMAIDDFGVGYSGLQILYNAEPDFLKIDRFFIDGISTSRKKQLFVKSIVDISQSLGIQTVAEGIETKEDFLTCKAIGCNMAQGYFIAKPTKKIEKIKAKYSELEVIHKEEKRSGISLNKELSQKIENLKIMKENDSLDDIFKLFKNTKQTSIIPIIRDDNSPAGIIREADLKEYIYSPYGRSLLFNITKGKIKTMVVDCGCVDINDSLDKILRIYANRQDNEGVIVTHDGEYLGFLSAKILLDIVNEKNILNARDQNPLTGLPGNIVINEYISSATVSSKPHILVYFDLDNFKPFNDYYGFRNGDRVIKLLGTCIKKGQNLLPSNSLAGHIGGDDFFLGWESDEKTSFASVHKVIANILKKFSCDVESFYSKEDREKGYIIAKNRHGIEEKFGLMTTSAALLVLNPKAKKSISEENIAFIYAKLKKHAKNINGNAVVAASLVGN